MNEHGLEETIKSMRNRNRRLDREGDYWSQAEKDRLHNLFDEGIGLSEIAIRLQRTVRLMLGQRHKPRVIDKGIPCNTGLFLVGFGNPAIYYI